MDQQAIKLKTIRRADIYKYAYVSENCWDKIDIINLHERDRQFHCSSDKSYQGIITKSLASHIILILVGKKHILLANIDLFSQVYPAANQHSIEHIYRHLSSQLDKLVMIKVITTEAIRQNHTILNRLFSAIKSKHKPEENSSQITLVTNQKYAISTQKAVFQFGQRTVTKLENDIILIHTHCCYEVGILQPAVPTEDIQFKHPKNICLSKKPTNCLASGSLVNEKPCKQLIPN